MLAILGIDAAWTATEPSGVALLRGEGAAWECIAVAPSYSSFVDIANGTPVDWTTKPIPGLPEFPKVFGAAEKLLNGASVDLITVDMPLSRSSITCRRSADDKISSAFGGRGCAVHSPSAQRPGPIADLVREECAKRGFLLATTETPPGTHPALLEVFPHTALLSLQGVNYRVPYKVSKMSKYWRTLSPVERRTRVLAKWQEILTALGGAIGGIALNLPAAARSGELKRYEDAIDALVCGWVGVEYLSRRAEPYGDTSAAIWTVRITG